MLRACLNLECKILLIAHFLKETRQVFERTVRRCDSGLFRKNLAQLYSKNSINKLQDEF
jgi:hypothetical protein